MTYSPRPLPTPQSGDDDEAQGQPSEGPSGFSGSETQVGGADSVPDTPDDVTETYVGETDATRRRG